MEVWGGGGHTHPKNIDKPKKPFTSWGGKVMHSTVDISFILQMIHTNDAKTHGDGHRTVEKA